MLKSGSEILLGVFKRHPEKLQNKEQTEMLAMKSEQQQHTKRWFRKVTMAIIRNMDGRRHTGGQDTSQKPKRFPEKRCS